MANKTSLNSFIKRKEEHITQALDDNNQAYSPCFDTMHLIHEALPELDFDEIELKSQRFGKPINTPFMVSSMTAGHPKGIDINKRLSEACLKTGWAMGVGSQRRELTDESAAAEWQAIQALNLTLFGNIGLSQLIVSPLEKIEQLVKNIGASAMQVHLNPLQECIQEGGTPHFKAGLKAIQALVKHLSIPVVVKETGCGMSEDTCKRLYKAGVHAIDVSGLGGTHWGRIEGARAHKNTNKHASQTFKNWGINTIQSIKNAASVMTPQGEIWGSGGVRNGLDAAKCLALGANTVGIAKPMLEAALIGVDEVIDLMRQFEFELKIALFCTGSKTITELQEKHRECF